MSESESQKHNDSLPAHPSPKAPNREGEAPPEPTPKFASPQSSNPYQSPEHVGTSDAQLTEQSPHGAGMALWIGCLVFLPLVLGNLCFWPTFLLGLQVIGSSDYGLTAGLTALAACSIAGLIYGVLMARYGMRVMYGRDWRGQSVIRSRFLPLAIGLSVAELFLFPASVVGGCFVLG